MFHDSYRVYDPHSGIVHLVETYLDPTRLELQGLFRQSPGNNARATLRKDGSLIAWNAALAVHDQMGGNHIPDWDGSCILLDRDTVALNDIHLEYWWDDGDIEQYVRPTLRRWTDALQRNTALVSAYGHFTVVGFDNTNGTQHRLDDDLLTRVTRFKNPY